MSGTPSAARLATAGQGETGSVEALLQELLARQARDAQLISDRFDRMQAEIDSRAPALDVQHAAASAGSTPGGGASVAGPPGWLRRIVAGAVSPAPPPAAASAATEPPSTPAPLALVARTRFDLQSALPPGAPAAPTRGIRRLPPAAPTAQPSAEPPDPDAAAAKAAAARARAAVAVDVDEDDDDYFDALDEQLEQLDAAPDAEKSLAERFGGHFLPLPHVAKFWPRDANFQSMTCHYHPALAGDRLNGGLVDNLSKIGEQQRAEGKPEWGATYAYELRTLVATCSYVADAFAAQKSTCAALNTALRAGHAMPGGLEGLPQDSLDMAVQLQSIFSHLKERVDVLRAAARQSAVDVEILARLYDAEERIAGDRSELGAAVEARSLEGATRSMIAASAKERVAAARGASFLTPRGPPPRERVGGGLQRSLRDRARRLQPAAAGGRAPGAPPTRPAGQQSQQQRTAAAPTAAPRPTSPGGSHPPAPNPSHRGGSKGSCNGGRGSGRSGSSAASSG